MGLQLLKSKALSITLPGTGRRSRLFVRRVRQNADRAKNAEMLRFTHFVECRRPRKLPNRGRALQMLNFSINLIVPITYVPLPGMASLTQFPHFAL